uniref:DUF6534 domain-containing protein n=2 Tax=Moniliophthora roreri TaxID=221103 RepID=A0A0W0GFL2_MONRR
MSQFSAELAGPLLLAFLLNWFLFGVLSVQVYLYWTVFPTGNLAAQMLVCSIYILETAQTISLSSDAFQTFVYGFTNAAAVDHNHNLWLDTYIYDGLVAFLVQTYFAHRIHVLLFRTKLLPAIIVLLSTTQFAGAIGAGLGVKRLPYFSRYGEISPIPGLLWISGAIVADILIAVTMIYALSRYDTTFRETRNFVRRLKRLAMETGSVTAGWKIVTALGYRNPQTNNTSETKTDGRIASQFQSP